MLLSMQEMGRGHSWPEPFGVDVNRNRGKWHARISK
jgi:hypothetical protein